MSSLPTPLPYKDFTIKARLFDSEKMAAQLTALKAEFIGLDLQTDHYFETEKGKLKWREGTLENLITHYERLNDSGMEQTIGYQYDLNPSPDQISELIRNHRAIGITTNERGIYNLRNLKIHLDKLPNHEEFIEIEAIDREDRFTVEELKYQCLEIKSRLKIADSDLIPTGYLKKS